MDRGHRYTDRRIEALEKKLGRHYQKVSKKAKKRLTAWLNEHSDELDRYWQEDGRTENIGFEIPQYLIDELTETYTKGDADAMKYIGAAMTAVFLFNHNDKSKAINRKANVNIPIIKTVERISRRKRLLQPPNPDKMKDRIWHRVKINYVIREGIKNGKSIDDIANRLEIVTRMDKNASYRAARTACTNAENQGKLEAMYKLRDEYGIDCKKMWYATLDNRTRTSHREMHGEIRELGDAFSNGLQFPADPDGNPAEVWNCRCTLLEVIDNIDIPEAPKGMSREEWESATPKYKHYPK